MCQSKSIHDLLFESCSNFYPICLDLRDNRGRYFETLSNRIFDLKIEGQGREEQCGILHYYMANCVAYNFIKMRVYLKPFVCGSHAYIIYLLRYKLVLKISIKDTHLKCLNNKNTQGSSSRKKSRNKPQSKIQCKL